MTGGQSGNKLKIDALAQISPRYDTIFCDVWGVVHNGVEKHASAEAALSQARRDGLKVVLLTNSPRPNEGVRTQLDAMTFSREAYDEIVTSGDVTRALIAEEAGPIFHIGPKRDVDLFAGLSVERVSEEGAQAVVCTGLNDDERETPADYADLLARLRDRGLPMICANPDIVVHRGERLIFCAGALARDYAAIGGETRLAGKPHRPIYEHAARRIGAGADAKILGIGDGLLTDIAGANGFGIDSLLVIAGIHGEELGGPDGPEDTIRAVLAARGLSTTYALAMLR